MTKPIDTLQATATLLGLATADALGAPLEFASREQAVAAVTSGLEMTGGGAFGWEPGEWTDDTSLALALGDGIVAGGLGDWDTVASRYIAWANSIPKDIGNITRIALVGAKGAEDARQRAENEHNYTGRTAGNGTIMRCAPIALAAESATKAAKHARADAVLTHFDPAAGDASAALCAALHAIALGESPLNAARDQVGDHPELNAALDAAESNDEAELARLAHERMTVCWTTLGIAICAVLHQPSYEAGVSWAISLGGDTDTNAAAAGALLGCRDGLDAIPDRWLSKLHERERIENLAAELAGMRTKTTGSMRAYRDYDPNEAIECSCGWTGKSLGNEEFSDTMFEIRCPECDNRLMMVY